MLREAFEPLEQFTANPRSRPDSLDSDFAGDLSRSFFCRSEIAASRRVDPHDAGLH